MFKYKTEKVLIFYSTIPIYSSISEHLKYHQSNEVLLAVHLESILDLLNVFRLIYFFYIHCRSHFPLSQHNTSSLSTLPCYSGKSITLKFSVKRTDKIRTLNQIGESFASYKRTCYIVSPVEKSKVGNKHYTLQ